MNQKNYEWDKYFLEMARFTASKSKDTSTKCGCVLVNNENVVIAMGYNGFPRGTEYDDSAKVINKPEKYFWFEHAERNAVYCAARTGAKTDNCKAYVTGPPCHDCARALVQSGIREVIVPVKHNFLTRMKNGGSWQESCERAMIILQNANILYREVNIDV